MPEIISKEKFLELLAGLAGTKQFLLFTGIIGSGKSTFAKLLVEQGFKRVSLDRMANRNPLYQINYSMLMDDYYAKLKKHLREGFSVVDDNVNPTADDRKRILNIPKSLKMGNIRIVHFDIPLATCLKWNKQRKVPAPSAHVEMAHRLYMNNQPTASEGTLLRVRPAEGQVDMWEVER